MNANVLIGLGAGLLSALLFASASTGTFLGLFVLFFLSPLPIAVAGLGWGWRAAAVAAATAFVTIAPVVAMRAALFHLTAIGAPTVALTYLALLNRSISTERGEVIEWYPIGRVVAFAALLAGALAALGLLTTATDLESLRDMLRAALQRMFSAPAGVGPVAKEAQALTPEKLDALAAVMIELFAASQATMWFAIALLNLWLGGRVVQKSERLMRPWPDLTQLRLPAALPIAFAAALGASFLHGFPGMIASGFAAAIMMAYVAVGLAILHNLTRGHALRSMILSGTYAALLLFALVAAPVMALIGLAEPFSPLRRSPPPPGTST